MPLGASCKMLILLTLSRVIPGCFWRLWWCCCPHYRWCKVPRAGYGDLSHLALASSHSPGGRDLSDTISGLQFHKQQNSFLGLLVAFTLSSTTTGSSGTSSVWWPRDMSSAGRAQAARAQQIEYRFCVVFILWCQWHQLWVGANMRPPRHIPPKVPWPEWWVPPSRTLEMQATALPASHDSALVWWPPNSPTAQGCLFFLHELVWTKFTASG